MAETYISKGNLVRHQRIGFASIGQFHQDVSNRQGFVEEDETLWHLDEIWSGEGLAENFFNLVLVVGAGDGSLKQIKSLSFYGDAKNKTEIRIHWINGILKNPLTLTLSALNYLPLSQLIDL